MILTRDGKEITAIYSQDGSEVEELKDENGRIVYLASREITGTLPLYFSSRGKPLTDYLISGNTLQDGTPTPEAPVDVVGCGEETTNLLPPKSTTTYKGITFAAQLDGTTICNGTAEGEFTFGWSVPASISGDYYFSGCPAGGSDRTYDVFCYDKTASARPKQWDGTSASLSDFGATKNNAVKIVSGHDTEVRIRFRDGYRAENLIFKMMLREPSAPSEFEPYGYKLPPTVNGTEYPIYLGQVPTARRIKKLVLTGEENWVASPSWKKTNTSVFYHRVSDIIRIDSSSTIFILADRFEATTSDRLYDGDSDMVARTGVDAITFRISDSIATTAAGLKAYLADQYAAGTPVTVWYVLAEPETGIVNEPLMKIGDYADTISFAQAGVTIPTVSGANVLDMTSAVKPSEVYIKGKGIKPTGNGG